MFRRRSQIKLPDFSHISGELSNGRSVRDGYTRGWGLQFGDLRAQILKDPLYQEAYSLAEGRSVQAEENRMNIFLLLKFYIGSLPMGHIVEFGSYKGGSAIFMAKVCEKLHPGVKVYAFDTFEGMPETDPDIDAHKAGDFHDVDYEELQAHIRKSDLTNLELVKGLFEDTAPDKLKEMLSIRLVHIDCDIRSAIATSYKLSKPYMVDGGYIAFDDALFSSCIGATEVVEDLLIRRDGLSSEQIFPHFVFRTRT